MNNPPEFGERRAGWYPIEGLWHLTIGAARKELEVTTKQFNELIKQNHVLTETLQNPHNLRPFTVYFLDSLQLIENKKL